MPWYGQRWRCLISEVDVSLLNHERLTERSHPVHNPRPPNPSFGPWQSLTSSDLPKQNIQDRPILTSISNLSQSLWWQASDICRHLDTWTNRSSTSTIGILRPSSILTSLNIAGSSHFFPSASISIRPYWSLHKWNQSNLIYTLISNSKAFVILQLAPK